MSMSSDRHVSSLQEIIELQSQQIAELQAQVKELLSILHSSKPISEGPNPLVANTTSLKQTLTVAKPRKNNSNYSSTIEYLQAESSKMCVDAQESSETAPLRKNLSDDGDLDSVCDEDSEAMSTAVTLLSSSDNHPDISDDDAMSGLHA